MLKTSTAATLFKISSQLRLYLANIGLQRIGGRGIARRLISREGFLPVEVDGRKVYQWWTLAVSPFEPLTTQLFSAALRPGSVVLDVGAYRGYYSFIAAAIASEGTIHAFEPAADNFASFTRGIAVNRFHNIVPVQKAVSDRSGPATLFRGTDTGHSLHRDSAGALTGTETIDTISIDEYMHGGRVDVIKVDVQGGEHDVLAGMRQTIRDNSQLVMFLEFCPGYLRQLGSDPDVFLGAIGGLGFKVSLVDETTGQLSDAADFRAADVDADWYSNLYCVKG